MDPHNLFPFNQKETDSFYGYFTILILFITLWVMSIFVDLQNYLIFSFGSKWFTNNLRRELYETTFEKKGRKDSFYLTNWFSLKFIKKIIVF